MIKIVLIDNGLNRIRDLIFDDIDQGELGTDGTAATESDTDLIAGDANTTLPLDQATKADKAIQFDYVLPSTGGSTTTYREYKLFSNASSVNYDRIVFTGISFTTGGTEDLNVSKQYFIRQV